MRRACGVVGGEGHNSQEPKYALERCPTRMSRTWRHGVLRRHPAERNRPATEPAQRARDQIRTLILVADEHTNLGLLRWGLSERTVVHRAREQDDERSCTREKRPARCQTATTPTKQGHRSSRVSGNAEPCARTARLLAQLTQPPAPSPFASVGTGLIWPRGGLLLCRSNAARVQAWVSRSSSCRVSHRKVLHRAF